MIAEKVFPAPGALGHGSSVQAEPDESGLQRSTPTTGLLVPLAGKVKDSRGETPCRADMSVGEEGASEDI